MSQESKLRRARKYLAERGIGVTAKNSKLAYTDSAGMKKEPPRWLKGEPLIVTNVEPLRRKG